MDPLLIVDPEVFTKFPFSGSLQLFYCFMVSYFEVGTTLLTITVLFFPNFIKISEYLNWSIILKDSRVFP